MGDIGNQHMEWTEIECPGSSETRIHASSNYATAQPSLLPLSLELMLVNPVNIRTATSLVMLARKARVTFSNKEMTTWDWGNGLAVESSYHA